MGYAAAIGLGFGLIENLMYLQVYDNDTHVLLIRSVTSLVCHMLCGLFMGFFIAMGHIKDSIKPSKWTKYKYYMLSLLAAVSFHGIFDYLISLTQKNITGAYVISGGLIIAYVMARKFFIKNFKSTEFGKI